MKINWKLSGPTTVLILAILTSVQSGGNPYSMPKQVGVPALAGPYLFNDPLVAMEWTKRVAANIAWPKGLNQVLPSPEFSERPAEARMLASRAFRAGGKSEPAAAPEGPPVLWRDPVDIETRDLYYGPGGKAHQPNGSFRFLNEDVAGTSPKFEIIGEDGIKWKAKLGLEARPETVASRLLWAAGYFANEDYFIPILHVENMPHLHRGNKDVSHDGTVHNVRLKRHVKGQEKIGDWSWQNCPFAGTREWYGLRVLMAVMNNWDLKDVNNSVYQVRGSQPEQHYVVSDLGASFGTTGLNPGAKGNLHEYRRSKWINGVSAGFVDFNVPSSPGLGYIFDTPEMVRRLGLVWLGRHIPVSDARWLGSLLARLSQSQIRDAFRAGGYSPSEVEEFVQLVERRIQELNRL
jgi:hypothetical protein